MGGMKEWFVGYINDMIHCTQFEFYLKHPIANTCIALFWIIIGFVVAQIIKHKENKK